jgi:hypothetical protein
MTQDPGRTGLFTGKRTRQKRKITLVHVLRGNPVWSEMLANSTISSWQALEVQKCPNETRNQDSFQEEYMALQKIPGDIQGKTGAVETIQIAPADKNTHVTIASVLYGIDENGPVDIPVKADGKTFDLTIMAGANLLQVTLFSPDPVDGSATAKQGSGKNTNSLEDDIEFVGGLAVWSPEILGT